MSRELRGWLGGVLLVGGFCGVVLAGKYGGGTALGIAFAAWLIVPLLFYKCL